MDVDAVIGLAPDLVIGNQEENTRVVLEALAAARVRVLVSLPRRVAAGIAHLARLARILGTGERARTLLRVGYELRGAAEPTIRAFVPIWMDPLMTLNADTYGSDVLAHVGIANAFGDRLPRVSLDEVRARGAELIVLSDEPYRFSAADEAILRDALPAARVVRVSGKDLFWYGAWTFEALDRLADQLAA